MARTRGSVGGTRTGGVSRRFRPLAIVAAAGLGLAPSALAAPAGGVAPCHGLPVTVDAHRGEVHGTDGPDVIRLLGPATVRAGAGDDVVCGSPGQDRIDGGPGADLVLGGRGGDLLRGGPGRDHLYGEAGADRVLGGRGADVLVRGAGADRDDATRADSATEGRYAISVLISGFSVGNMRYAGLRVGVTRTLVDPSAPLWASFTPYSMNAVDWSDADLSVFASDDSPEPGQTIRPTARLPISAPARLRYHDGLFMPETGPADPWAEVMNRGVAPATIGIAQGGTVNGSDLDNPLSAEVVRGGGRVTLAPRNVVTVFTTSERAGTMVPARPERSASVHLAPFQPTATFTYDDATGRFRSAYGTG